MKNNSNMANIAQTGIQTQKINIAEIMSPITNANMGPNKKKKTVN